SRERGTVFREPHADNQRYANRETALMCPPFDRSLSGVDRNVSGDMPRLPVLENIWTQGHASEPAALATELMNTRWPDGGGHRRRGSVPNRGVSIDRRFYGALDNHAPVRGLAIDAAGVLGAAHAHAAERTQPAAR